MTKLRRHYFDRNASKKYPERHLTAFYDRWEDNCISVMICNKRNDDSGRTLSLSLNADDAEALANLLLHLAEEAREAAKAGESA